MRASRGRDDPKSGPSLVNLVLGPTTGGIGRHVAMIVAEAKRRGAEVCVFGPEQVRGLGFEELGAQFMPIDVPSGVDPLGILRAALRLRNKMRGADIVHGHGLRAGTVAALSARWAGVSQRVVTIHNAVLDKSGWLSAAAAMNDRILRRLATQIICVSRDLASELNNRSSYSAKVVVIPVGAELHLPSDEEVRKARLSTGVAGEEPLIVAVGRLHHQKGFDVLIEAMARVSHRPQPIALIAGEGPERQRLESMIAASRVGERVHLLGYRRDAAALIAGADIFCMPSRWEGSPLSLHEAMALERPIIASRTGGIPDMLSSEAALLVEPDDTTALAGAIDRLLTDRELASRLGEAAGKAGAAWPDAKATAATIADLYEEMLGRPLRAP